jgi:hypothetical protein
MILVVIGIVFTIRYEAYNYIVLNGINILLDPEVNNNEVAYAQRILSEIESLTVYDTETYQSEKVDEEIVSSIVDLEQLEGEIRSFKVAENIVKTLFPKAKYKPEFVLWKGDKLGMAKLKNGDEIKIRISFYGSFFAIVGIEGYYVFDDDIQNQWEKAIDFSRFDKEGTELNKEHIEKIKDDLNE